MNWVWTVKIYFFSCPVCAVNAFTINVNCISLQLEMPQMCLKEQNYSQIITKSFIMMAEVNHQYFKETKSCVRNLLFDDVITHFVNKRRSRPNLKFLILLRTLVTFQSFSAGRSTVILNLWLNIMKEYIVQYCTM